MNKKISQLDALGTAPAGTDILPITDVSGTPTTKKVTVANLMAAAPVQSVNSTNVTAAGALMDSEVTNLDQVKAFDSSAYATVAQGTTADNAVQPTDSIDVLADVDTSTTAPTTADFLKWGGSNWVPAEPTADVDGPLTTALRGTDNPHIGAYPNQSFKVIDNPSKSVMIVADEAGNLKLLNSLGVNNIAVGFSVVEDGDEPDIEVVSGSETYSVISGDSDTKGANDLPIRQGFNLPDIGANPAPILISGGSIV